MRGSLVARTRFPLEVFDAVRLAMPPDRSVSVRVSATDWVEGGWDLEQTLFFVEELEKRGCDAIHVSSGACTRINASRPARAIKCPLPGP